MKNPPAAPVVALDETDLRILAQLQRDASLSNQTLAERVHLTPAPCLRRVKRLCDEGVIERTVALLSRDRLGLGVVAYAFISLDSHRVGTGEPFEALVRSSAEIVECVRLSGEYDYLLRIVVRSMHDYSRFLDERLLKCPSVRSVNSSFDLGVLKQTTALPLRATP